MDERFPALLMWADDLRELEALLDHVPYQYAKHIAALINRLMQRQQALVADWERWTADQTAADLPAPLARAAARESDPQAFLGWVDQAMNAPRRDRDPIN